MSRDIWQSRMLVRFWNDTDKVLGWYTAWSLHAVYVFHNNIRPSIPLQIMNGLVHGGLTRRQMWGLAYWPHVCHEHNVLWLGSCIESKTAVQQCVDSDVTEKLYWEWKCSTSMCWQCCDWEVILRVRMQYINVLTVLWLRSYIESENAVHQCVDSDVTVEVLRVRMQYINVLTVLWLRSYWEWECSTSMCWQCCDWGVIESENAVH